MLPTGRNGVVATTSPGVAAQDATQRKPRTAQRSMQLDGLHSILRAGGGVTTGRRGEGGYVALIQADGRYQQTGKKAHGAVNYGLYG